MHSINMITLTVVVLYALLGHGLCVDLDHRSLVKRDVETDLLGITIPPLTTLPPANDDSCSTQNLLSGIITSVTNILANFSLLLPVNLLPINLINSNTIIGYLPDVVVDLLNVVLTGSIQLLCGCPSTDDINESVAPNHILPQLVLQFISILNGNCDGSGSGNGNTTTGISCSGDSNDWTRLSDLEADIQSELLEMLATDALKLPDTCQSVNNTVRFLLYNSEHRDTPIELTYDNLQEVYENTIVKVLVHGAYNNPSMYGMINLKNTYIQLYNCSVIVVDWPDLAYQQFSTIYCNIPYLAPLIGQFLCSLSDSRNIDMSSMHLVCQGTGAQMCGLVGQNTQETSSRTIGRITALNPTGILYKDLPEDQRLDKTDAGFVDAIHTYERKNSTGIFGTVDFFVNCGVLQPSCPQLYDIGIDGVPRLTLSDVVCNRKIGWDYMAISATSNKYTAKSCSRCPDVCYPDEDYTTITMGEHCPPNPPSDKYTVQIDSLL